MADKTRKPGGEPAPSETPQPGQQMQDDGSSSSADGSAEGEDDTGTTFANINPTVGNP